MKTIILGFDALDKRYLDQFSSSLPHFSALRDRGVEAPLKSTHPPWTGSAWPSMYTGTDPSDHGVYGFFDYAGYPDDGTLVSRTSVKKPALWDYFSSKDASSVVMNVPVTHPVDPITGVLIPGYLAEEDASSYPTEVRSQLGEELGEMYTIYSRHETNDQSGKKFEGYLDLIDMRRRAGLLLLENYDWEVAVLQVQKTDAVFHNFSSDDEFRQVYEAADRMLGDVLETVDDDVNVIVCSDHGIGPVTGYTICVNEILSRYGYVKTTDTDHRPTLSGEKSDLTGEGPPAEQNRDSDAEQDQNTTTAINQLLIAAQRGLAGIGIEPNDIYTVAERLGIEQALVDLAPDSLLESATKSVDWENSRAYCPDSTRMGIRVNLEGREPNGVVPQSEYETVRDELINILEAVETPDGEPAFEFVCRREAVYDGPYTDDAPDVLFLPTDMNHQISPTMYGKSFISTDDFDHKQNGMFIADGPAFSGSVPDQLSLTDVAPIAMASVGRPVPETMTGTVPDNLLTTAPEPMRAAYGEISYGTGAEGSGESASTDTDDEVTDRLEDLGYL